MLAAGICCSCQHTGDQPNTVSIHVPAKKTTAAALLTEGKTYWQATPLTVSDSNHTATGIVKATFEKNGSFQFLYADAEITGTVLFLTNKQGQQVFSTQATRGRYLQNERPVEKDVLASRFSNRYRWERISFAGIPSEDFLLLVDLDKYPAAADGIKGSINKNWVTKLRVSVP